MKYQPSATLWIARVQELLESIKKIYKSANKLDKCELLVYKNFQITNFSKQREDIP